MTKREFWTILIKALGLYALINLIFFQFIDDIWYLLYNISTYSIISLIVKTVLPTILFIALYSNVDNIIRLLKLDKGSEEKKIEFGNINAFDVVRIAVFIIGGLLVIENTPSFINNAIVAFSDKELGDGFLQPKSYSWAVCATNIVIGCLLMMYKDAISKVFVKKKEEFDEDIIDELEN